LFKKVDTVVAMTVTTLNLEKQRLIEPDAPSPDERFSALARLSSEDVKTVARIDPLIPTLTDSEVELRSLVTALAETGVKHITASTLKPVEGFFPRLEKIDFELHERLMPMYVNGELRAGYRYLNPLQRREMITRIAKLAKQAGLTFGSCREGFPELNTAACDGASYFSSDEFAKSLKTSSC
jgi:DNA repair photolyase